jgi:acyl-CoA reductase-like NAD-dependent aldehyde dehydrogenase
MSHESLYDAFVEKAVAWVSGLQARQPAGRKPRIGPDGQCALRARSARRSRGLPPAHGADRSETFPEDDGGAYLTPQILTDVTHDMRVMREESFGPVVGIMPVKDDDEAFALMNDSQFGLTASLWTADAAKAAQIGDRIETGTVFMNRATISTRRCAGPAARTPAAAAGLSEIGFHADPPQILPPQKG